jgi:hypothetical protein
VEARCASRGLQGLCLAGLLLAGLLTHPEPGRAASPIQSFRFTAIEADGEPSSQAGAHPDQVTTSISFADADASGVFDNPRNLVFDLPPGLIGNPAATPSCSGLEFKSAGGCSPDSQIGFVKVTSGAGVMGYPLFNLKPLPGAVGEFGFSSPELPVRIALEVRTGKDYGISLVVRNLIQPVILEEVQLTLWGVPADPSHDGLRGPCLGPAAEPTGELCPSEASPRPLLTNPSTCLPALDIKLSVDSWRNPGVFDSVISSNEGIGGDPVGLEGCEGLDFRPSLSVLPTVTSPRTPSGLTFELNAPQPQIATATAEATLEDAGVTLPRGIAISPPVAAGLGACAADQIRLGDDSQPSCPDSSKLGTVTIATPMLPAPLTGSVYLAQPGDNPFGSRFAIYAVAAADGVLIKRAGRVDPDPLTGQLRVAFADVPQLPFSAVGVTLFGGPRAPLASPPRCGTYSTEAELAAWGAPGPITRSSSFELSAGCSQPPFAPSLRAGASDPAAGAYSPFTLRLQRGNRDGEFASSFSVDLPRGVSAALRGTSSCTEAQLTASESGRPGCPDSSRVGSVVAAAGLGPKPLYLTGDAYLSGPFRGAPFSLAIIVPARAGPFDLGMLVERIAVDIDPRNGRLTTRAEGLPQIRGGVPLELQTLTLELDRPGFIRNPTSCEPATITGTATTTAGERAPLSEHFQVGGCPALGFKPRFALKVLEGTARGGHPALRAVLRARSDEAGVAAVTVGVPAAELLDLRHLGSMCDRELPARRCPASSRLGRARVWSPLLDDPLVGSIYLRTPSGRLPGLLVDLHQGGIDLVLAGRITMSHGTFGIHLSGLPDLPLSKAVFTLAGGRRGLLVNSEALCAGRPRAKVVLQGHNGALRGLSPVLQPRGGC